MRKLVVSTFTIQGDDIAVRYNKRFRHIFRWMIGEVIDQLKNCFQNGLEDAFKVVKSIIMEKVTHGTFGPLFIDNLMNHVRNIYDTYKQEYQRDLQLNENQPEYDDTNYEDLDFEKVDPDEPIIAPE